MTEQEFKTWLTNDRARRVALVEVDTDAPKYLSNYGYVTLPTDSPANREYIACVQSGVAFNEQMSLTLDGSSNMSAGEIDIINADGAYDHWLREVWVNRPVRVYLGDLSWPRSEFKLVFSGTCADLTAPSRDSLSISLRNKMERLNTSVTEELIGGNSTNKDRIKPVGFGECHNITPVVTNEAIEEFTVSSKPLESIIEARSNGVPITINRDLAGGKFRMTTAMFGTITASVQFGAPYANTAASIILRLVTEFGKASERLGNSDIDWANIGAFDAAHLQPMGLYLADRENVIQACQSLAASVGAQVVMTAEGLLKLITLKEWTGEEVTDIFDHSIVQDSLHITQRAEVVAGIKLGYCKNWTVQPSLETGIPTAHAELYAQEWLVAVARNEPVATAYRLYGEPEQTDTLLLRQVDAAAEASRRLAMGSKPHDVYSFTALSETLLIQLGSFVRISSHRFGLQDGKIGQVVGLQRDWLTGQTEFEVLI